MWHVLVWHAWHVHIMATAATAAFDMEGVEKVCTFLKQRGLQEDICLKIRQQKMDPQAIKNSTTEDLNNLGITTVGDTIALKNFVKGLIREENPVNNEKKRLLQSILASGPSSSKSTSKKKKEGKKKAQQERKVSLGWLHFEKEKDEFCCIRAKRGGGSRYVDVKVDANVDDIIEICKALFFPDGNSTFGPAKMMEFGLANYKQESLTDVLVDGVKLPFTLQRYATETKMSRICLYLTSKVKSLGMQAPEDDSSLFDFDLFPPLSPAPPMDIEDHNYQKTSTPDVFPKVSDVDEDDLAYMRSLRESRIPPHPQGEEPSTVISVRHISLGFIQREFRLIDSLAAVYDWVGSQSSKPQHFVLTDYSNIDADPSQSVADVKSVLYMRRANHTPAMEETVNFYGFGVAESFNHREGNGSSSSASTNPLNNQASVDTGSDKGYHFRHVSLPEILSSENNVVDDASSLETESGTFQQQRELRIRRSNVLQDMIKEFCDETIMSADIKIVMIDARGSEEAGEDCRGIFRDAVAIFWQEFYNACTLGERERVPSIRHDYQCKEWVSVAKIFVKGFQDLGYMPVMLSRAFVISAMFGEEAISAEILLESFCKYLSRDEEEMVRKVLKVDADIASVEDELVDFLDRFQCRKIPRKENVEPIILELAHTELVQRPQYVSDCWKQVFDIPAHSLPSISSAEDLLSVYKVKEPTNKKVLSMLDSTVNSTADQASLDFLKRFIRGMELSQLKSFLMFVTGSDVVCVSRISVEYTKLEGLARRPIAHTCGCVLELPTTYENFAEFRSEFTNILLQERWQMDIM